MALVATSFLLALFSSVMLLAAPMYSGSTGQATLLQINGMWVLIPLPIPVLITAMPMFFEARTVRVGAAIAVLCSDLLQAFR